MPWNHPDKIPAEHLARLQQNIASEPIFRWVLDQIASRGESDGSAQAWLDAFFPEKDLSGLLPKLTPLLLSESLKILPHDYFRSSVPYLKRVVRDPASFAASYVLAVLLEIAPSDVGALLSELKPGDITEDEFRSVENITRFFATSQDSGEADEFAVYEKVWAGTKEKSRELQSLALARPDTRRFLLYRHPDALFSVFLWDGVDVEGLPGLLDSVLETMEVHPTWISRCGYMRSTRGVPSDLSMLLMPEAPLPLLKKALKASDSRFLAGAISFALEGAERAYPGLTLLFQEMKKLSKIPEEKISLLGEFALAVGMHCWQRKSLREFPLLETLDFLDTHAPLDGHPLFEELLDRLESEASPEVVAQLLESWSGTPFCISNIALALARVEPEEAATFLVEAWRDDEDGESRVESELLRLGAQSESLLVDACRSDPEEAMPLDILAMIGGDATVELLLELWPRMRVAELGSWTHAAALLADPRLLAVLEDDLDRENKYIDDVCTKLAAVLDRWGAPHDAAAKRNNHRQNLLIGKCARDMQSAPIMVFCDNCGFENELILSKITAPDEDDEDFQIPDPPPCPQCGAETGLELAEQSRELLFHLLAILEDEMKDGEPYEGLFEFKHGFPLDIDLETSEETVAFAEKWVARDPDNVPALILLMLERGAAGETSEALALARRVIRVDPMSADANLLLVLEAMEDENFAKLHLLADRLLPNSWEWSNYFDLDADIQLRSVLHEVRKLPRPKPSNVIPLSHTPEVKRTAPNDLCPCGSGRKFKKCCGRIV